LIASSHLQPMSADETATYVLHRLATANWHQDPHISMGALRRIHIFSRGIPRRVNQICSRLLLYGVVEDRHTLDSHDVQAVIMELRHEHLAPASDIDPPEGLLDEEDEFVADFSENHLHYLRMDAVLHNKREVRPTDETGKISHIEAYKAATPKKPVNVFPDVGSQSPKSIDEHQESFIDNRSSVASSDEPDSDALSLNLEDSEISPEVASDTPLTLGDVEGLDEILSASVSDGTEQRFFAIAGIALAVVLVFTLFIQWENISANLPGQNAQIKPPPNRVAMVHGDARAPVPQSQPRLSELDRLQAELSSTMEAAITRLGQGPSARLVMTFPPSMSFALGHETIKPVLDSSLRELAAILAKHKAISIRITGHSDLSGSLGRNEYLSGRRAQVVMARLAELGIDGQRLKAIGRGSRELKSTTDPRKNRRVEITLGQS
jgi:outer membrane protein OmpA-like peptidoglycan-associated protein